MGVEDKDKDEDEDEGPVVRTHSFALRKPLLCRKIGAKTQRGAHAKPPENSEVAPTY
ncbi:hypothetical protein ACRALDRAFT_2019081 [Sodiomyces alcalophilus JCM 7366]|uniref:uncharacterized protein n=1 Tax=Sodiomyces alcalophilus JCM 7366 TaxID=591952 RepID=UPI0039B53BAA